MGQVSGGCGCTIGGSTSFSQVVNVVQQNGLGQELVRDIYEILGLKMPGDESEAKSSLLKMLDRKIKGVESIQRPIYDRLKARAKKIGLDLTDDPAVGFRLLGEAVSNLNSYVRESHSTFSTDLKVIESNISKIQDLISEMKSAEQSAEKVELLDALSAEFAKRLDIIKSIPTDVSEVSFDPKSSEDVKFGQKFSQAISQFFKNGINIGELTKSVSDKVKEIESRLNTDIDSILGLQEKINSQADGESENFKEKINSLINILSKNDYMNSSIIMSTGGAKRADNLDNPSKVITGEDVAAAHQLKGSKSAEEQLRVLNESIEVEEKYMTSDFYNAASDLLIEGEKIAQKIGKSIRLTPDVRKFIDSFQLLRRIDHKYIYYSLSGMLSSDEFVHDKLAFISNLKSLKAITARLDDSSKYAEFVSALDKLIKMCEHTGGEIVSVPTESVINGIYNSEVVLGGELYVGGGLVYEGGELMGGELMGGKLKGGELMGGELMGGELEGGELMGGEVKTKIVPARHGSVSSVSAEMRHNYIAKKILNNLHSGQVKDLEASSEEYLKINANEVAYMKDMAQVEYEQEVKFSGPEGDLGKAFAEYCKSNSVPDDRASKIIEAYRSVKLNNRNIKIGLLNAMESLDIYLRDANISMIKDPETVKSMAALLSEVSIVSKWFDNKSGDHLANVFESFPCKRDGGSPFWATSKSTTAPSTTHVTLEVDHYYEWVAKQADLCLGNPNMGFVPETKAQVENIKKLVRDTVSSIRVIENILNVLDKSGKKKISAVSPRGPKEIYNAIQDYIVGRSITTGFNEEYLVKIVQPAMSGMWFDIAKIIKDYQLLRNFVAAAAVLGAWWLYSRARGEQTNKYVKWGAVTAAAAVLVTGALKWLAESKIRGIESDTYSPEVGIIQSDDLAKIKEKLAHSSGSKLNPGMISPDIADSFFSMLQKAASKMTGGADLSSMLKLMSSLGVNVPDISGDISKLPIDKLLSMSDKLGSKTTGLLAAAVIDNIAASDPKIAEFISRSGIGQLIGMAKSFTKVGGADFDPMSRYGSSYGNAAVDEMQLMLSSIRVGQFVFENSGVSINGSLDTFPEYDFMFEMMIKSIVSKIFQQVGVWNLFHKTHTELTRPYAPVRLMLGAGSTVGGGEDDVKVIDGAVGLYLRLPLLAEFYKEFFQGNGDFGDTVVGLVPNFSRLWHDFLTLILCDSASSADGSYNDSDIRKIVSEVNKLYNHFKVDGNPEETESRVVQAMVREINSRYGFVHKSALEKLRRKTKDYEYITEMTEEMPSGTTLDSKQGDLKSDSMRITKDDDVVQPDEKKAFAGDHLKHWTAFNQFIDRYIKNVYEYNSHVEAGDIDPFALKNSVNGFRKQLSGLKDEKTRFQAVRDIIQGSGKMTFGSHENALMFVELVITPIAVLNSITQLLQKFCAYIHGTNQANVREFLDTIDAKKAGSFTVDEFSGTANSGFAYEYCKFLSAKYKVDQVNQARLFMMANALNAYLIDSDYTVQTGVNGATSKYTAGKCRQQDGWTPTNKDAWMRFGMNRQAFFRDFISNIFSIGIDTNKLVDVSMTSGRPILSYDQLQHLCMSLLEGTKTNINRIRGTMKPELIRKYEVGLGSINWLENRLIKGIFLDADGLGLPRINNSIKSTYDTFTKKWSFDASNPRNPKGSESQDSFDDAFASLVYWNYKVDSKAEIKGNMGKTEFPDSYIPTFKTGSNDPVTAEERELNHMLTNVSGFLRRELLDVKLNKIKTDFSRVTTFLNASSGLKSLIQSVASGVTVNTFTAGFPLLPLAYILSKTGEFKGSIISEGQGYNAALKGYIDTAFTKLGSAGEVLKLLLTGPGGDDPEQKAAGLNQVIKLGETLVRLISVFPFADSFTDNMYVLRTIDIYKKLAMASRIQNQPVGEGKAAPDSARKNVFAGISNSIEAIYSEYNKAVYEIKSQQEQYAALDERLGDFLMLRNRLAFYGNQSWEKTKRQSLLVTYNEIISKYITYNSDGKPFGRVYTKLFSEVSRTAHAGEIGPSASGIKDMNYGTDYLKALNAGDAVRFDPPDQSVLFASLGKVLQSITKMGSKNLYSYSEIGEAPPAVVTTMQANLPAFEKLFEVVALYAIFLSSVVNSGISLERVADPDFSKATGDKFKIELNPSTGVHGGLRPIVSEPSSARKTYYISLLGQLTAGSRAFGNSCADVLRSISGSGFYLETGPGFMKHFHSDYKQNPLMPLSSLTYFLNRKTSRFDLLPTDFGANNAKFKLLYGVRDVLSKYNELPRIEQMQGVKHLVERFGRDSISMDSLAKFVSSVAIGVRYVTDTTDFRRIVGGELGYRNIDLTFEIPELAQTYQYNCPDVKVVEITESSNIGESIMHITESINPTVKVDDRCILRVMNIQNLNIVPFSIHEMMREIPLVNVINGGQMYDRFLEFSVAKTVGTSPVWEFVPATTRRAIELKMLTSPFGQRSDNEYYALITQLLTDQPFLRDQLLGKALLGSVYPRATEDSFLSPSLDTAIAIDRWRQENKGKFGPYSSQAEVGTLTYAKSGTMRSVKVKNSHDLAAVGRVRFDTFLVRSIVWLVLNHQLLITLVGGKATI